MIVVFISEDEVEYQLSYMKRKKNQEDIKVVDETKYKQVWEYPIFCCQNKYYTKIEEIGCLYLRGFIDNHPLTDGNKRMGLLSLILFLNRNGYHLKEKKETDLYLIIDSYVTSSDKETQFGCLYVEIKKRMSRIK